MNIYKKKLINNSLRLNSIANYFIELTDKNDFIELHKFIKIKNLPVLIIGEGTNVVLPDIFEGIVVKPNFNEINFNEHNNTISAGSSVNWHEFVIHTIDNNILGFENLSSIPGSVGASPIQNIGAYGVEINEYVVRVSGVDLSSNTLVEFSNKDCEFSYRDSVFKKKLRNKFFITSEDYSFFLHIANLNGVFIFLNKPLGYHTFHKKSMSYNYKRHMKSKMKVLKYHTFKVQTFEKNKQLLFDRIKSINDIKNSLREDNFESSLDKKDVLANSPSSNSDYVEVPLTVKKESQ